MSVKIEIRDTDNSITGVLDVGNSEDFPLALTKKLSDFNSFNARSGVFSTDFEVPATPNNNKLFKSIHNINIKDTKAFFKKKDAIIYSNDYEITRGRVELKEINNKDGVNYYKFVFYGDNLDWVTQFSELLIVTGKQTCNN